MGSSISHFLLVLFVHHVLAVAFHVFLTVLVFLILVLLHLLHGLELTDLFFAQILNVLSFLLVNEHVLLLVSLHLEEKLLVLLFI